MALSVLDYVGIIVPIATLTVAVVKLYLEQRKAKRDIELSKRGLKVLSRLVEAYQKGQTSQLQLQKEKLELEKWKAAAKAFGWLWERVEEEE